MNINIFDFDGVLSSPIEDAIFRLDEHPDDDLFIAEGRKRYGITNLSDHVRRNRHLILQECLYERGMCPYEGPLFPLLMESKDPFYVLTARSGPGAVARVSQFFEKHDRRPEEMFFVGPVSKTHILIDLCDKHDDHTLTFYDDTAHHIEAATNLGLPNLNVSFVDNDVSRLKGRAIGAYKFEYDLLVKRNSQ